MAPFTEEHKRKLSVSHLGNRISEETKLKLSIANKGKKSWNTGIGIEDDERVALVAKNLIHFNKGYIPYNKGVRKYKQTKVPCLCGCGEMVLSPNRRGKIIRFVRGHHLRNKIPWNKGKKCLQLAGVNHWNWQGGITPNDKKERIRFRNEMQEIILERDRYTCQICGKKGGNLQVDHIQPWAEYIEGRFDINNCRTLCVGCHYAITFGKPMPSDVVAWGHNICKIKEKTF